MCVLNLGGKNTFSEQLSQLNVNQIIKKEYKFLKKSYMKYFLFTVCLGLTKKEWFFRDARCACILKKNQSVPVHHTRASPRMNPELCRFYLEFNSTRKHFCHIFIRKLRFSRYTAEKGKCIPAYLTRMQRLLIEQTRRGYRGREKGRKGERERGKRGGGRREKRRREKGERGGRRENRRAGEREKGEKGEGEGRKGPPCTPLNKHIIRNGPTWSYVGRIYAQQQVTSIWRHRCRSKQFRLEDHISWQKTNFLRDKICVSYVLKQQNVGGAG